MITMLAIIRVCFLWSRHPSIIIWIWFALSFYLISTSSVLYFLNSTIYWPFQPLFKPFYVTSFMWLNSKHIIKKTFIIQFNSVPNPNNHQLPLFPDKVKYFWSSWTAWGDNTLTDVPQTRVDLIWTQILACWASVLILILEVCYFCGGRAQARSFQLWLSVSCAIFICRGEEPVVPE